MNINTPPVGTPIQVVEVLSLGFEWPYAGTVLKRNMDDGPLYVYAIYCEIEVDGPKGKFHPSLRHESISPKNPGDFFWREIPKE